MSDNEEQSIPARNRTMLYDDDEDSIDFHDRVKRLWQEMTPERFDLELNRALFSRRRTWMLRCDYNELPDEVHYSCELPGVEKDDINVEVSGMRFELFSSSVSNVLIKRRPIAIDKWTTQTSNSRA